MVNTELQNIYEKEIPSDMIYDIMTEPQFQNATDKSRIIRVMLLDMGAATHLKGFGYLCRAIEMVYDEPDAIHNVVSGLYARIAKEAATTPSCVERDIRTELKVILTTGSLTMLDTSFSHFGCRSKSVPARKFIALFAEKLRNDLIEPKSQSFKSF